MYVSLSHISRPHFGHEPRHETQDEEQHVSIHPNGVHPPLFPSGDVNLYSQAIQFFTVVFLFCFFLRRTQLLIPTAGQ